MSWRGVVQNSWITFYKLVALKPSYVQNFESKFENMTLLEKSNLKRKILWKIEYLPLYKPKVVYIWTLLVSEWEL